MILLLMGVSGAGKTTVGRLLANELGWEFADADDFHSPQNVAKMRAGVPLDDADREPWLTALAEAIRRWAAERRNVVLACSALKEEYRSRMAISKDVRFVYLRADYETIRQRLAARRGHYMNAALLRSQFDTLEEPRDAVTVDAASSPEEIAGQIRSVLHI